MRFKPTNIRFRNVLYISRLDVNLISISKLYINDYVGEFNKNTTHQRSKRYRATSNERIEIQSIIYKGYI